MPEPTTSFLVLQTELVTHLKLALQDIRPAVHILTPSDLASETDTDKTTAKPQPVPAVNVVYLGHRFGTEENQQRSDGKALRLQQLFVAEVVTRNVRSLKSGAAAREDGGELAIRVLHALMGARLPTASGPLKLRQGPGPVYRNGMQYLPLPVQAELVIVKP